MVTSIFLAFLLSTDSWGLKGGDAGLYHGGRTIKSALFKRPLRNGDIVMVCLDFDNLSLQFSVNGEITPAISCPDFKGVELFPAVSLIEDSDAIAAEFGMRGLMNFFHLINSHGHD